MINGMMMHQAQTRVNGRGASGLAPPGVLVVGTGGAKGNVGVAAKKRLGVAPKNGRGLTRTIGNRVGRSAAAVAAPHQTHALSTEARLLPTLEGP